MSVVSQIVRAPLTCALTMALALGLCILIWKTQFSSSTAYLPRRGHAEWILYPAPTRLGPRRALPFVTRFYRAFQVNAVPASASLHVRALRSAQVWLNGQNISEAVVTPAMWKQGTRMDVAARLRRGENVLIVEVENSTGPPVLWLDLALDEKQIVTDTNWSASLAGGPWRPAKIAGAPAERARVIPMEVARRSSNLESADEVTKRAERFAPSLVRQLRLPVEEQFTLAALKASWQRLIGWGAAAIGVAWIGTWVATSAGVQRWLHRNGYWSLLAVLMCTWSVWIENNAPSISESLGFDADAHHSYVQYVQEQQSLPLANQGWETFQPPLYYVAAATTLGAVGETAHTESGEIWLRRLGLVLGLIHLACCAVALRLIFPLHPRRQALGLVFAACLPVHLYLFHHVTNDLAGAALGSLALVAALIVLRQSAIGCRGAALLGATLGFALLAKATALSLVAAVFLALAYRLWSDHALPFKRSFSLLVLAMTVCGLVIALHYGRAWWHFGTPLIGNWDPRSSLQWWSDPAYQTLTAYLPHGDVLLQPLNAGANNIWDTFFSTLWGDGHMSGSASLLRRPPWNYPAMLVGYALAMIPTAGLIVGAVALARSAWRSPTPRDVILLGAPILTLAAMLWMTLAVPGFGQTKAMYLVPAAICLSAMAGWGWDILAGCARWQSCVVLGLIGLWGANSLYAFWVPRQGMAARQSRAFHLATTNAPRAVEEFQAILRTDPASIEAHAGLGVALLQMGRYSEAVPEMRIALAGDPGFVEVYMWLADAYEKLGQSDRAIELLRAAMTLAADFPAIGELTGLLLERTGHHDEAHQVLLQTLQVSPDRYAIHMTLAEHYARRGDFPRAFEHARYANELSPTDAPALYRLARSAAELGRDADAITTCRAVLQIHPDLQPAQTLLAWVLATSADDSVRDPVEAIRLARLANQRAGNKDPEAWDALAAALAAIGNYEKAVDSAAEAIALARATERVELFEPLEARHALYQQKRVFRRPAFKELPPQVNLPAAVNSRS